MTIVKYFLPNKIYIETRLTLHICIIIRHMGQSFSQQNGVYKLCFLCNFDKTEVILILRFEKCVVKHNFTNLIENLSLVFSKS